jgi:hypothetical protein
MGRIARITQFIFGSSAGFEQVGEFGSFANGTPAYATTAAQAMSLPNWESGWFSAIEGNDNPAIEDMNATHLAITTQLAEIFQDGIPPWDSGTTYYTGSLATGSTGIIYVSLQNSNTNNALTQIAWWWPMSTPGAHQVVVGNAAYCTHASLAAAVADSNVGTNVKVLLTQSVTLANSVVALTKAGWQIEALPGVTYTAGGSTSALSCNASGIIIKLARFVGFTSAITFNSSGTYCRIKDCNFNTCTKGVDTTSAPTGGTAGSQFPLEIGSIYE